MIVVICAVVVSTIYVIVFSVFSGLSCEVMVQNDNKVQNFMFGAFCGMIAAIMAPIVAPFYGIYLGINWIKGLCSKPT